MSTRKIVTLVALARMASACGSSGPYRLPFMPAPDVYAEDIVDPFADSAPIEIEDGNAGILYVTNRARKADTDEVSYPSRRGHVLRAGIAKVKLGKGNYSWEEARRISLLKNRSEDYPLQVSEVTEFGVIPQSVGPLQDAESLGASDAALEELLRHVQAQLDRSSLKVITIYIHGYKVVFENPILVSAELWHYLGYEGAFIAFSWPSTPSTFAYFADSATAEYSGAQLRKLITLLSSKTTAEQINIIGYSAGTRVVVTALDQLNLLAQFASEDLQKRYLRLGHIILVGADADRDNFARIVSEGALDIAKDFNIYISSNDQALGMSRWLLAGQNRLGQTLDPDRLSEAARQWLLEHPGLRLINVSDAENAKAANGHGYFRQSPWVSGDILVTLRYGLPPQARGLEREGDLPVWTFPTDYLARLREAIRATSAASAAR